MTIDEQQQSRAPSLEVMPHIGGGDEELQAEKSLLPFNWRTASLALMAIAALGGSVYMLSGSPGGVPQKLNPTPSQQAAVTVSTGSKSLPSNDVPGGPLAMIKEPLSTRVVSGIRKNPVLAFGLLAAALLGLGVAYYLMSPPEDTTIEDPEKPTPIVNLTLSELEKTKGGANQTDEPNLDKDDSEKSTLLWLWDLASENPIAAGLIALVLVVLVILAIWAGKKYLRNCCGAAAPIEVYEIVPIPNTYYSVLPDFLETEPKFRDFYIDGSSDIAMLLLTDEDVADVIKVKVSAQNPDYESFWFIDPNHPNLFYSSNFPSVCQNLTLTVTNAQNTEKKFNLTKVTLTNYTVEPPIPGLTFTVASDRMARLTSVSVSLTIKLKRLNGVHKLFSKGGDGIHRILLPPVDCRKPVVTLIANYGTNDVTITMTRL